MSSDAPTTSRLAVVADLDVHVSVYDGTGARVAHDHGTLSAQLPRGLYRVLLERGGGVTTKIVDLEADQELRPPAPPLKTPTLIDGAASSHEYYTGHAVDLSHRETAPPLGAPPHTGRLLVFVRRESQDVGPRSVPSERLTLHDVNGRELASLSGSSVERSDDAGYLGYAVSAAPGIYRLRANTSRRDIAIPVPRGRAVQVFAADIGRVRIDDLRIFIPMLNCRFDPESPIGRAMEAVISALKVAHTRLPRSIAALLEQQVDCDLCLDLAAALLLLREDALDPLLDRLLERLAPHAGDIPDIAIVDHVHRRRRDRSSPPPLELSSPPLFRESFLLAMNPKQCGPVRIHEQTAIAQSARSGYHDSVWWTWSHRVWDARWLQPTIDNLRGSTPASIAATLGVPPVLVESTIAHIHATTPASATIDGYEVGGLVGRGSHGVVHRAKRLADDREVALKLIALDGDPQQRIAEIAALERYDHRHLAGFASCGSLHGDAGMWLELELCRGSVMDRLAELGAPMAVAEAVRITLEALDGLAYLHRNGITHRDVRPRNLLIRTDGSVAVADFGLARLRDPARPRPPGTARFAAPEQLADPPTADPSSDVWSAAATLYFMLTLEAPRDELADQSELEAARTNPVIPIRDQRPDLPAALADLLDRSLSPDPSHRPRDASELRQALLELYSDVGIRTNVKLDPPLADAPVPVGPPRSRPRELVRRAPAKVLFLSATAERADRDAGWLDIDREYNEVQAALDFPNLHGHSVLEMMPAVQWAQMPTLLTKTRSPLVLHFSGHAGRNGELSMLGSSGMPVAIAGRHLLHLVSRFRSTIPLIVLNACYTAELAEELTNEIGVVLGTDSKARDAAAMLFSRVFYDSLIGRGESIASAFEMADSTLVGMYGDDAARPLLKARMDVDPSTIYPFQPLDERERDQQLVAQLRGELATLAQRQATDPEGAIAQLTKLMASLDAILNRISPEDVRAQPTLRTLAEEVREQLGIAKTSLEILTAKQMMSQRDRWR